MFLLLLTNLGLIVFTFICFKKKLSEADAQSLLKHIGLLEVAWTGFLLLFSLFLFFDIMETKEDGKSFLEMASKEKIMLLSILVGFGIIHLSIFVAIFVKLLKNDRFK